MKQGYLFGNPENKKKSKSKKKVSQNLETILTPVQPFDAKKIMRSLLRIADDSEMLYNYSIGYGIGNIQMNPTFIFENATIVFDVCTNRSEIVFDEVLKREVTYTQLYGVRLLYPISSVPVIRQYENDLDEALVDFRYSVDFLKKYPHPENVQSMRNLMIFMKIIEK